VTRGISIALAVALVAFGSGCGGSDDIVDPLLGKVDQARDAQALTSLQQAETAAALVRTESGGSFGTSAEDFAQRLQARDPSKRFTTGPSNGPEQIQVLSGGGVAMLVARGQSASYVGVWDDGGGSPTYYHGVQPPAFTAQRPAGAGWSPQPLR
jgi:hypothetical protein